MPSRSQQLGGGSPQGMLFCKTSVAAPTHTVQERAAPTHRVQDRAAPTHTVQDRAAPTHTVQDRAAPTSKLQDRRHYVRRETLHAQGNPACPGRHSKRTSRTALRRASSRGRRRCSRMAAAWRRRACMSTASRAASHASSSAAEFTSSRLAGCEHRPFTISAQRACDGLCTPCVHHAFTICAQDVLRLALLRCPTSQSQAAARAGLDGSMSSTHSCMLKTLLIQSVMDCGALFDSPTSATWSIIFVLHPSDHASAGKPSPLRAMLGAATHVRPRGLLIRLQLHLLHLRGGLLQPPSGLWGVGCRRRALQLAAHVPHNLRAQQGSRGRAHVHAHALTRRACSHCPSSALLALHGHGPLHAKGAQLRWAGCPADCSCNAPLQVWPALVP